MFVKTITEKLTLSLLRLETRNDATVLIIKKCYGFHLKSHVITTAATKTRSPWTVTLSW